MSSAPLIELQAVTFSYSTASPLFHNFSLEIHQGETWAVLGPSGCGKSTLLNLLAGLRFPESGSISINGTALKHPRPQTGLIIQDHGLLPWATVRQNAELGQRIRTFYGPDGKHVPSDFKIGSSVDLWLDRLNLMDLSGKYPSQLSGGQRQRTAIARTLSLSPDLLLMDEPFSSLDAPTREQLQNLTLELQAEQELTLVVVTHSIEEAVVLGRKILLLGSAPNLTPQIIRNPLDVSANMRGGADYLAQIQYLRTMMNTDHRERRLN